MIENGINETLERNIANIQNDLINISKEISDFQLKSYTSYEWHDLAKREILNADDYLNQSKNYFYNDTNSNKSILYLINAESSIHKAKGFFTMANEKNLENATSLNFSMKMDIAEKVSERWISYVESAVNYYETIGYNNTLEYPKQILYQAINYNSEGLFYIAMMNAAYAKALLEYYTHVYSTYYNYSQALSFCKTYLDLAKLTMNIVCNNSDVDVPLAKSIIEQAELHSQDAENEGIENGYHNRNDFYPRIFNC